MVFDPVLARPLVVGTVSTGPADDLLLVRVTASGAPDPSFLRRRRFTPPVTVQLHNTEGICWGAVYSAPNQKNQDTPFGEFKDKAD